MSGKKDSIIAKVTDFGLSGLSAVMSGRAVVNPGMSFFWNEDLQFYSVACARSATKCRDP
jgi:hypothetical protein